VLRGQGVIVCSVLIGTESYFLALGVEGDEFNKGTGDTVSVATTVSERHTCVYKGNLGCSEC
jgi:hypothetical protein